MMRELKGTKLKKLDFELQKKGDIYSFEGPFLSHFRDERGFDYLMNWVDVNSVVNRWQLVKVSNEQLNKYFSKKISLLQLIKTNETGAVHFLDIDSKANYQNIWVVSTDEIPNDYSPQENSFFDIKYADKYALELAKENKQFLSSSKVSFMQKAVKQLFGTKASERNIFLSHSINSPWSNEPNTIDEMTTLRALYFPLLLHYHQNRDNIELRNLIATHSQAYTNSYVCRTYLHNLRTVIIGHTGKGISTEHYDIKEIFEDLLESTNHLVQQHPDIYQPLYKNWIDTIEVEYDNIEAIHKHLDAFTIFKAHKKRSGHLEVEKKRNKS